MITLESKVKRDEYTQFVQDAYDLKVEDTCKVSIPMGFSLESLGNNWNIGLIVGASGSGKSTILKSLAGGGAR